MHVLAMHAFALSKSGIKTHIVYTRQLLYKVHNAIQTVDYE